MLTKRERLAAVVAGQAVDRPPVALWRHFPGDDQDAADLAAAHLQFQQAFDFDFLKVTPASTYMVDAYGVVTAWRGNEEGTRDYVSFPLAQAEELAALAPLDVLTGSYAKARQALQQICAALDPDVTVLQTIFSPLSQLKKLVGPRFFPLLRLYPQAVHAALETLTNNSLRHIETLAAVGVSGIFFAVQHAAARQMSREEYAALGRPFDLRILQALPAGWFNVLHLHGSDVYFEDVADYPVQAINWHDRETWPNLTSALTRFPAAVIGGIRQWETLGRGTPAQVEAEARDAYAQTGGQRFMLGTGCVTPITAPLANLHAVRRAVEWLPSGRQE